jgi:hypothetical protein
LRKFLLLAAGVALSVGTLSACFGGPPPPQTEPKDVLVVGDSVAFSFGCVLGDAVAGVPASGCPASPDYSTKNFSIGACTIYGTTVSLYNGGSAGIPNCDTVPGGADNRTWAEAADHYTPKVVVINTGGWEIVDRWLSFTSVPDSQWGGPTNQQAYINAATYYSSALYQAISEFRGRGAKVVVAIQPNASPPQPEPPPSGTPAGLECSWWEPYPPTAPASAGPDCTGDATQGGGGTWRSPTGNTSYRSSRAKLNQFNTIVNQVLTSPDPNLGFGNDPNVSSFNFKKHFNEPGTDNYTNWICPPPQDSTVPAQNVLDFHTTTNLTDTAFQCDNGNGPNSPANPWTYAINARAPDQGHLSVAGQEQILRPYLEACIKALIPVAGGDPSKCS